MLSHPYGSEISVALRMVGTRIVAHLMAGLFKAGTVTVGTECGIGTGE